ncbi:DNA cytosine methyltransferase [Phenylobacterium sp.]|uniref:DNA cytosine methyltransferase n=1 Tax=Phenylobacterium sp. TaxID=1871053 RepID=UPI002E3431D9|nr:DNA cytosine methyltransferase [Phenylobacterium sp.]HEX3365775.1 DNA cytosine methyltransferase [Phenylobacterium sp.]
MASFYEFFAGGGMARAGLGEGWDCLFANDFDAKKGLAYQANWGAGGELHVGDVRGVTAKMLPDRADLVWGSFPCQDLSLAGVGAGLDGERSGSFYPFWGVIKGLIKDGRAPAVVAVENVCGTLTSHGGRDFEAICKTFKAAGYRAGALVINADLFVPQSRPRLFIVGVRADIDIDPTLTTPEPIAPFHSRALCRAVDALPKSVRDKMVWWNLPLPERRLETFADVIEEAPDSVDWHTQAETKKLLDMMSAVNRAKVDAAKRAGRRIVGGVYRRTRLDEAGRKVQRAEVRFDDVAGCLRTPAGGSSRQVILVVDGLTVRSRLISSRETARLMGLPDSYRLPRNYNEAYHLTGDGVAAPVVRYLAQHIFEPVLGVVAAPKQDAKARVAWRA